MAADAAFAVVERPPSPLNPPLVIVRRRRLAAAADASAAVDDAPTADGAADGKGPRTFRVDTPLVTDAAVPLPADDGEPVPPARVPRKHRIATDRRPGPILQVFQAPVERAADPAAREQALGELAGLEPVFESIRRAQSFSFDGDCSGEWRRLSLAAGALQSQIALQLGGVRRR